MTADHRYPPMEKHYEKLYSPWHHVNPGSVKIVREQFPLLIDIDGNHWHFYPSTLDEWLLSRDERCSNCGRKALGSGFREAITQRVVCDWCIDRNGSSVQWAPADTLIDTEAGPYVARNWSLNPHLFGSERKQF